MSEINITDLKIRIEKIEDVLASVAAGEMDKRINPDIEDDFTGVEAAIDLLINDLTEELSEREKASAELKEKLNTIEKQKQTIEQQQKDLLELSSPVIKVWDNVLILPVIGAVDSRRAQIMMENLLQSIVDTNCTLAILDITGVLRIDTQVANHLLKTVAAVRLLGGECIVSGISPAIAQTIVHLGIDLSSIKTKANLQEAMRYAFQSTNPNVTHAHSDEEKKDEN
jgi:rsbT co-antagonist protein RsbR